MKPKSRAERLRKVLVLSPLALSLLALPADARERQPRGEESLDPRRDTHKATQEMISGPTGSNGRLVLGPETPRRVRADPERQRRLEGRVVGQEGQTLYVQGNDVGTVVPFDISALRFRDQPQEGQEVRVTYQVEDGTDNVAVRIAGEVDPAAQQAQEAEQK